MRVRKALYLLILCCLSGLALCQVPTAAEPERGSIIGTTSDADSAAIPGATIIADGPDATDHQSVQSDGEGNFKLTNIRPAIAYRIVVSAKNFAPKTFESVTLLPGQVYALPEIKLIPAVEDSVDAVSPEMLAVEEVQEEETQRILGIIPNFYVVYDQNAPPLSNALKLKLALKASTDVVTLGAAAFIAGLDQAADTPNYVQGAKGYGQRVGANYADAVSDVLIGGAILPVLLHQDPRYFYQGTGTNKSRMLHALEAPFICKGDNGHMQFNTSSVAGDIISGAMTNIYYPPSNRGVALVFDSAGITTAGRIINALAQEFVLSKITTKGKAKKK